MSSFEELLIENVRENKSLYDVFSADYKDQNIRREAWEEIGKNLQMSAEKCKSEWTKLRNCFLNAIRRRRSKTSGQGNTKNIPPWRFSQQMEFILPFLENREVHSNLETGSSPSSIQKPNADDFSEKTGNTSLNVSVESQPADTISNSDVDKSLESKKEISMKRKKPDHAGELVDILRETASIRKEKYEKKQFSGHDDVELFYLSMAKIAKRLPKAKEAKLRMEICNKVSEAELAHLVEIETATQPNTSLNRQTPNPVFYETQNQPVHLQPQNLSLHQEQSESSWSTSSNSQTYSQPDVYDKQNYCRPILHANLRLNNQHPFTYISEEGSSNQYESLN